MSRKQVYRTARRSTVKSTKNKSWAIGGLVLVVVLLAFATLEVTNTTHLLHNQKLPTVITTSKTSPGSSASDISSSSPSASQSTNATSPNNKTPSATGGGTGDSSLSLIVPYGNFVSNHHPGDNSSLDEVSICSTTPGASCYIKFTNASGDSTRLPVQNVGSDGSTSWSWNVDKDAHLGTGEWQITAVATLNSQTKSTGDPVKLEVK